MRHTESLHRAAEIMDAEREALAKINAEYLKAVLADTGANGFNRHEKTEAVIIKANAQRRALLAEIAVSHGHAKTVELMFGKGSVQYDKPVS